jgi:hypothetical protein
VKCKKIYISAIFEGAIHDQEDQKRLQDLEIPPQLIHLNQRLLTTYRS